jgi:hypothetical protein
VLLQELPDNGQGEWPDLAGVPLDLGGVVEKVLEGPRPDLQTRPEEELPGSTFGQTLHRVRILQLSLEGRTPSFFRPSSLPRLS